MSAYVVSYDLMSPGQDYSTLIKYLGTLDSAKALESVWLVSTSMDAEQLRDGIKTHTDANDKILVVRLSDNWATQRVPAPAITWLRKHVAA